MADRPFNSLIEARDALTAEILAGKLELSPIQSAIFRVLTENTLYKPTHPEDYGFVVTTLPTPTGGDRIPFGVETIAKLTGYKPRAVKTALADLQDMKLIRRLPRPNWYGGRSVDRIRLDWVMPEGAPDAPSEAMGASVGRIYGAADAPSGGGSGAADAPSIGEEGSREEGNNKGGVTTQTQSQTQNSGQASAPSSLAPTVGEILAVMPDYAPSRVWYAPGIPEIFREKGGRNRGVWFHPGTGLVSMGTGISSRPGPDWEQHYMSDIFHTPWNYLASPEIELPTA